LKGNKIQTMSFVGCNSWDRGPTIYGKFPKSGYKQENSILGNGNDFFMYDKWAYASLFCGQGDLPKELFCKYGLSNG